jgi:hypothetical protein
MPCRAIQQKRKTDKNGDDGDKDQQSEKKSGAHGLSFRQSDTASVNKAPKREWVSPNAIEAGPFVEMSCARFRRMISKTARLKINPGICGPVAAG